MGTSSVTVRLYNAWTSSSDVVQSIFYQYKNDYNNKCYEVQDVAGGATYEDVTIQCLVSVPYAELEIWIEDGTGNVLDADGDNTLWWSCAKPSVSKPSNDVAFVGPLYKGTNERTSIRNKTTNYEELLNTIHITTSEPRGIDGAENLSTFLARNMDPKYTYACVYN